MTIATDIDACRKAGVIPLNAGTALGLKLHSIVVPQETNLLLNVRHADIARVTVVASKALVFTCDCSPSSIHRTSSARR